MRFKSFLMTGARRSHPSGPYQTRPSRWLVSLRQASVALACAAAGGLGIAAFAPSHAAGFDCSKASTLVESFICADPYQLLEIQRASVLQREQYQNIRCAESIASEKRVELERVILSTRVVEVSQFANLTPKLRISAYQCGSGVLAGFMPSQPAPFGSGDPVQKKLHPVADVDWMARIQPRYIGELMSEGVMLPAETEFRVERSRRGTNSIVTGTYRFQETSGAWTRGRLEECNQGGGYIVSCRWVDIYGTGPVIFHFEPHMKAFSGKWGVGRVAQLPWNGVEP